MTSKCGGCLDLVVVWSCYNGSRGLWSFARVRYGQVKGEEHTGFTQACRPCRGRVDTLHPEAETEVD